MMLREVSSVVLAEEATQARVMLSSRCETAGGGAWVASGVRGYGLGPLVSFRTDWWGSYESS